MRLAVIHHSADGAARQSRFLLADFCRAFEALGNQVVHLRGAAHFVPADAALLHVNLSVVPSEYVALGLRYPLLLNGSLTDTRKRRVSQAGIQAGESYVGPVIVKTDLNHGGIPERSRQSLLNRIAAGLGLGGRRIAGGLNYPIFKSLSDVPAALRDNPDFVIEKFMPERQDEDYLVRQAYFLGDRGVAWRLRGRKPIIRAESAVDDVEIPVPAALERYRRALGVDYGKLDYVEHHGRVTVLDVNKTIGGSGTAPETVARLLPGLMSRLAGLSATEAWAAVG